MRLISTLVLVGCVSCYDTQEELDDFIDRTEPLRVVPTSVDCDDPFDVSGRYLFGVATSLDKTKPLRFDATWEVDTSATPWELTITAQAMAVADGALVGNVVTATSVIGANGAFSVDFGTIVVPASANPITPFDTTATLVLEGCTQSEDFACGIVDGQITAPIAAPLAGSTWGLVPLVGDPTALELVTACPE